MSRPQKTHCQYPLAALCLSCKWFRPDFLLHQSYLHQSGSKAWHPRRARATSALLSCVPVLRRLSLQGQQTWALKVWGSQPKREHYSRSFIAQPAHVSLSSSATHSYSGGHSVQNPGTRRHTHSAMPGRAFGLVLWAGWSHQWDTTGELRQTQNALAEPWYFQL